jgi:abnormal spindle-like microcephaly-associated protein
VKTSRDVLLKFSNSFLSGEGDVTRHLSLLGLHLTYSQNVIDEIDYRINRLETDLRDGIYI